MNGYYLACCAAYSYVRIGAWCDWEGFGGWLLVIDGACRQVCVGCQPRWRSQCLSWVRGRSPATRYCPVAVFRQSRLQPLIRPARPVARVATAARMARSSNHRVCRHRHPITRAALTSRLWIRTREFLSTIRDRLGRNKIQRSRVDSSPNRGSNRPTAPRSPIIKPPPPTLRGLVARTRTTKHHNSSRRNSSLNRLSSNQRRLSSQPNLQRRNPRQVSSSRPRVQRQSRPAPRQPLRHRLRRHHRYSHGVPGTTRRQRCSTARTWPI